MASLAGNSRGLRRGAGRRATRTRTPALDPSKLHARLRAADFGRDLLPQAVDLERAWSHDRQSRDDELRYLQARCVVTEIFDYFGDYGRARRAIEADGDKVRELLLRIPASTAPLELRLWKRRIWVLISYAHAVYRTGDYEACLKLLRECQGALEILDGPEPRSFGTRARLQYSLGQVYRQLNDLESAEAAFLQAMKDADDRLRLHIEDDPTAANAEAESKLANWAIAKCVTFGLGWIRYTRGQISSAEPLISVGRTLLRGTKDSLHTTYADLLYGSIQRARAGMDPDRLKKAVQILEKARYTFGKWRHTVYAARAAYELSLAFLQLRDPARAREGMLEVRKAAAERNDRRWLCNSRIVESRILREEGSADKALETAQLAVRDAEFARERLCHIDALIACGEAILASVAARQQPVKMGREFNEAQRYFEEALSLASASNNAKVKAICYVHLARMFAQAREYSRAHAALRRYEALKKEVESGFVHDIARRVYDELELDFVIDSTSTQTLKYDFWRERLQEFLLRQAQKTAKEGNVSAVADALGISRQTLYTWLAATRRDQKSRT